MPTEQIGSISILVIKVLGLSCPVDTPILLGDTNTAHMNSRHPKDYATYSKFIPEILEKPDYVRLDSKHNSIEYVKKDPVTEKFVKIAVRKSKSNVYFARSIYTLNSNRVQNFIAKGTLKKV